MLTQNQQALVNRLASKYRLANCTTGQALWDNDIEWSQGRTSRNAVSDIDIRALVEAGLLERESFGGYRPTFLLLKAKTDDDLTWTPSDDAGVYRGAALR